MNMSASDQRAARHHAEVRVQAEPHHVQHSDQGMLSSALRMTGAGQSCTFNSSRSAVHPEAYFVKSESGNPPPVRAAQGYCAAGDMQSAFEVGPVCSCRSLFVSSGFIFTPTNLTETC